MNIGITLLIILILAVIILAFYWINELGCSFDDKPDGLFEWLCYISYWIVAIGIVVAAFLLILYVTYHLITKPIKCGQIANDSPECIK